MKKRATCFLLAVVILLSALWVGAVPADAASSLATSDECVNILKAEEGFSKYPYWDYAQYTVGYGTRCPSEDLDRYMRDGITEEEAETLLRNYLILAEAEINRFADKHELTFTQAQFDALILFTYNCGSAWCYSPDGNIYNAVISGATGNEFIWAITLWCNAGGKLLTGLVRRRLMEANLYLNGEYSRTVPENYCYVIYDANGGTVWPRIQGYDSNESVEPKSEPTFEGYQFDGWYTEKKEGTKVTELGASHKGMQLYAHWLDKDGNAVVPSEEPVTVTVTGSSVNVRSGPGTNYSIVGNVKAGDELVIAETAYGSGYTWGRFDENKWIALQYTNYSKVIEGSEKPEDPPEETTPPTEPEPTEPQPTEPKPTEPQPTEPKPTEPKPTEPEPTEPQPTEPQPTEPKPTEPESPPTVMGTVKVNEFLRIRSGPGTGYSVVGTLKPNDRVKILEQKTVGSMVWGKIDKGWISLQYVVLDPTPSQGSSQSVTGTVKVNQFLRIRSGPGTSYAVAGHLKPNDKVEILEQKKVGSVTWGRIDKGWISMDYIVLDSGSTGNTGSSGESVMGTVNVKEFLRIRSGPGASYVVAGYLKPNDRVEILEQRKVGNTTWGRISKGWISLDYVVLDKQGSSGDNKPSGTTVTKTVTADCLRIRSDAGTSYAIVGYLYQGAKVEILETKTVGTVTWGRIAGGWICLDYVK